MRSTRPPVSPSSPASIAAAMRSRSGNTIVAAASRDERVVGALRPRRPTATRPAPYASSIASRITVDPRREQLRLRHEHLRRRSAGPCGGGPRRAARSDRPARPAWPAWRRATSSGSSTSARDAPATRRPRRRLGRRRLDRLGLGRLRRRRSRPAPRLGPASAASAPARAGSPASAAGAASAVAARSAPRPDRRGCARTASRRRRGSASSASPASARRRASPRSASLGVDDRAVGRVGSTAASTSVERRSATRSRLLARLACRAPRVRRDARFDLRERFGRLEERALHDAVRVEQVVAPAAQLVDLRLQQAAAAEQIGEHTLARRLRFVEHLAALLARGLDDLFGLAFGTRALLLRVRLRRRPRSRPRAPRRRRRARRRASRPPRCATARPRRLRRAMRSASALRLLDELRGALLGLGADLVGGLAGRAQEPGRLGAQRVEQLAAR